MERELYRQNPYLYLLALGSGRATLVFGTIQVQAGQPASKLSYGRNFVDVPIPDPSKEWSPEPR
jgi:hypothetical protein